MAFTGFWWLLVASGGFWWLLVAFGSFAHFFIALVVWFLISAWSL
jgi:hypothetical protein